MIGAKSTYPTPTRLLLIVAIIVLSSSLGGCNKPKEPKSDITDNILIQIGDSALRLGEVVSRIPVGIDPADSINLFDKIVDTWIQNLLLQEVARNNLTDMSRIDAMVEEYRNQLIISEYRRRMKEGNVGTVSSDSIHTYYDRHPEEMILERPLIKGIYLKLPENNEFAVKAEACLRSATARSIDQLEKDCLRDAMQYDLFINRWVAWQEIADLLPCRISDPDKFVSTEKFFKIANNGSVYMLRITDYLESGEKMPYDFAKNIIANRLNENLRNGYEQKLVNSLYKKALRDGKLKKVSYDPVSHQRIVPQIENR